MRQFTVGVVGCGAITRNIHLPVLLNMPQVRVAWVADRSRERAASTGTAFGIKQTVAAQSADNLPESQVALLAIPVGARAAYWDGLAAKQTAVFTEKPFAATVREHCRIADLFPSHRLGCSYMMRFYASTILLRHLLEQKWFGPLRGIRIAEGGRTTRTGVDYPFIDDSDLSFGGALADLGCHSVDLALHLTGAHGSEVESCKLELDGRVDRKASARVRLKNSLLLPPEGVQFDYCVSWLDPQKNVLELKFDRVSLWVSRSPSGQVFLGEPTRPLEAALLAQAAAEGASTLNQAYYLAWEAFLLGLEAGRESPVSANSAAPTTALVEKMYEKASGDA